MHDDDQDTPRIDASGRNRRSPTGTANSSFRGSRRRGNDAEATPVAPVPSMPTFNGFRPTDEMLYLRAAWYAASEQFILDPQNIAREDLQTYMPKSMLPRMLALWDDDPGFREYLQTPPAVEHAARMEWTFSKALDSVMAVLADLDPKSANARVQAFKLLADLGGKSKPRSNAKAEDDGLAKLIASMDTSQLLATAQAGGKQLQLAMKTGKVPTARGPSAPRLAEETVDGEEYQDPQEQSS